MARSIVERQQFPCPAGAAHVFVERDFELRRNAEQRILLHVRVPLAGLLSLDKEVEVVLTEAAAEHSADGYAMDVTWQPSGGPFPSFRGILRIAPVGDEACILQLAGVYEPPGGALGVAFDAALGRRIAQSTMRDLVARIGGIVMAEYERRVNSAIV